jgi:hypothetical protein
VFIVHTVLFLAHQFKKTKVVVNKPTLKAIHICNSHQPTLKPKIAKEYVFVNAENQAERYKASG